MESINLTNDSIQAVVNNLTSENNLSQNNGSDFMVWIIVIAIIFGCAGAYLVWLFYKRMKETELKLDQLSQLSQLDKLSFLDQLDQLSKLDQLSVLESIAKLDQLSKLDRLSALEDIAKLDQLSELEHLSVLKDFVQNNKQSILQGINQLEQLSKLEKLDQLNGLNRLTLLEELPSALQKLQKMQDCIEAIKKKLDKLVPKDRVAYDAAVDKWLSINEHLNSLGKDRRKIQPVYSLLAGQEVPADTLQKCLGELSEERRETVSTIINDIHQFMRAHRQVIDEWLADEDEVKSFTDAIRMPVGQPFNHELDTEVTGEEVPDGSIINTVTLLGYYFKGSRNGGYRTLARVII